MMKNELFDSFIVEFFFLHVSAIFCAMWDIDFPNGKI